ncbi:MAG: HNH endonuclease [Burkholderiaceae bacterium]|nr:HNH endonuclease [Burkholderiaceae bacterium]
MAAKRKTVFEIIMYEYAKLIADRAIEKRSTLAPAARTSRSYWSFVAHTYHKLAAENMSPSSVLRENQILVTGGNQCAYCGTTGVALHWEHIIPVSRNGPNTIDNMVLSCAPCNLEKGARNPLEWFAAKGLGSNEIPRLVMGKLLKVVLEKHRACGTENLLEYPPGAGLDLINTCLVFDYSHLPNEPPSSAS